MAELPTLEDVARLSKTSRSTVSRVINNQDGVSEETREKVLTAIQELDYQPNRHARGLVTGHNAALGIIVPRTITHATSDPFFTPIMDGIYRVAHESGFAVMLWILESQVEGEWLRQQLRQSYQIDGAILVPSTTNKILYENLLERKLPCVTIGRFPHQQEHYVDIDNQAGAELAVKHLINLGYKRIAMLTGRIEDASAQDRLNGYKRALRQAGCPLIQSLIVDAKYEEAKAYYATRKLLQTNFDALFAANDSMAIGAMQALHEAGLRIPQDIAIVGFDDIPRASLTKPGLTTIRQPLQQFGEIAARFLLEQIRLQHEGQPGQGQRMLLPMELIIRESCGYTLQRD